MGLFTKKEIQNYYYYAPVFFEKSYLEKEKYGRAQKAMLDKLLTRAMLQNHANGLSNNENIYDLITYANKIHDKPLLKKAMNGIFFSQDNWGGKKITLSAPLTVYAGAMDVDAFYALDKRLDKVMIDNFYKYNTRIKRQPRKGMEPKDYLVGNFKENVDDTVKYADVCQYLDLKPFFYKSIRENRMWQKYCFGIMKFFSKLCTPGATLDEANTSVYQMDDPLTQASNFLRKVNSILALRMIKKKGQGKPAKICYLGCEPKSNNKSGLFLYYNAIDGPNSYTHYGLDLTTFYGVLMSGNVEGIQFLDDSKLSKVIEGLDYTGGLPFYPTGASVEQELKYIEKQIKKVTPKESNNPKDKKKRPNFGILSNIIKDVKTNVEDGNEFGTMGAIGGEKGMVNIIKLNQYLEGYSPDYIVQGTEPLSKVKCKQTLRFVIMEEEERSGGNRDAVSNLGSELEKQIEAASLVRRTKIVETDVEDGWWHDDNYDGVPIGWAGTNDRKELTAEQKLVLEYALQRAEKRVKRVSSTGRLTDIAGDVAVETDPEVRRLRRLLGYDKGVIGGLEIVYKDSEWSEYNGHTNPMLRMPVELWKRIPLCAKKEVYHTTIWLAIWGQYEVVVERGGIASLVIVASLVGFMATGMMSSSLLSTLGAFASTVSSVSSMTGASNKFIDILGMIGGLINVVDSFGSIGFNSLKQGVESVNKIVNATSFATNVATTPQNMSLEEQLADMLNKLKASQDLAKESSEFNSNNMDSFFAINPRNSKVDTSNSQDEYFFMLYNYMYQVYDGVYDDLGKNVFGDKVYDFNAK